MQTMLQLIEDVKTGLSDPANKGKVVTLGEPLTAPNAKELMGWLEGEGFKNATSVIILGLGGYNSFFKWVDSSKIYVVNMTITMQKDPQWSNFMLCNSDKLPVIFAFDIYPDDSLFANISLTKVPDDIRLKEAGFRVEGDVVYGYITEYTMEMLVNNREYRRTVFYPSPTGEYTVLVPVTIDSKANFHFDKNNQVDVEIYREDLMKLKKKLAALDKTSITQKLKDRGFLVEGDVVYGCISENSYKMLDKSESRRVLIYPSLPGEEYKALVPVTIDSKANFYFNPLDKAVAVHIYREDLMTLKEKLGMAAPPIAQKLKDAGFHVEGDVVYGYLDAGTAALLKKVVYDGFPRLYNVIPSANENTVSVRCIIDPKKIQFINDLVFFVDLCYHDVAIHEKVEPVVETPIAQKLKDAGFRVEGDVVYGYLDAEDAAWLGDVGTYRIDIVIPSANGNTVLVHCIIDPKKIQFKDGRVFFVDLRRDNIVKPENTCAEENDIVMVEAPKKEDEGSKKRAVLEAAGFVMADNDFVAAYAPLKVVALQTEKGLLTTLGPLRDEHYDLTTRVKIEDVFVNGDTFSAFCSALEIPKIEITRTEFLAKGFMVRGDDVFGLGTLVKYKSEFYPGKKHTSVAYIRPFSKIIYDEYISNYDIGTFRVNLKNASTINPQNMIVTKDFEMVCYGCEFGQTSKDIALNSLFNKENKITWIHGLDTKKRAEFSSFISNAWDGVPVVHLPFETFCASADIQKHILNTDKPWILIFQGSSLVHNLGHSEFIIFIRWLSKKSNFKGVVPPHVLFLSELTSEVPAELVSLFTL